MIDLHAHTTCSDGSLAPEQLLRAAEALRLQALAITDHDTFQGYEQAAALRRDGALALIQGIELSCKLGRRSAHLLGYFLCRRPAKQFEQWLEAQRLHRRQRNLQMLERLRHLGADIALEEVEAAGRGLTGRPHFARLLVAKGFAQSYDEAFHRYLSEGAPAYVEREAPTLEEGIERIRQAGGVTSLAHPIRLRAADEASLFRSLADRGLDAIEVFHPDHTPADSARYLELARKLGLAVTGGSDFHGEAKPTVQLGSVPVHNECLEELRRLGRR